MFFAKALCFLGFAHLTLVACQTTEVCDSETSVCFQQLFDPRTNTTLGFITPPSGNASDSAQDIIVKIVTPLPYGFAGLGFSPSGSDVPPFSMAVFMTFRTGLPGQIATFQTTLIGQHSALAQDGQSYVPSTGLSDNPIVSISSNYSYASETQITSILRCQGCPAFSFSPGDSLTIFRSTAVGPVYPAPAALNATLPLRQIIMTRFPTNSDKLWATKKFSSYAKALGFT